MAGEEIVVNNLLDMEDVLVQDLKEETQEIDMVDDDDDDGVKIPKITISAAELQRIREPWRKTLIVKLLGMSLSFNYMYTKLRQEWQVEGDFSLIDLGNDYYIAKIDRDEDINLVINGVPWIIADHYLTIQRWKPNFRPSFATNSPTAVWIRLPGLPVEYFDKDILICIGNALGRTLKIDKHTAAAVMGKHTAAVLPSGKYARICVEVDLNKPLVARVLIDNVKQKVEYEGLHLVCFGCGCYGHRKENCMLTTKEKQGGDNEELPEMVKEILAEEFGPWMLASTRRSREEYYHWIPPKPSWVKLNVDGCAKGSSGHAGAGAGAVVRDHTGQWVCGFSHKLEGCQSDYAILCAIYHGLVLLWSKGFRQVEVESDSTVATEMLQHGVSCNHPFFNEVYACRELLGEEWKCLITHCSRERNFCADWMANFSHTHSSGKVIYEQPPQGVCKFLADDANSIAKPRRVMS